MAAPSKLPEWAALPAQPGDVVEPNQTQKDQGWHAVSGAPQKPPYQWFNYWQNLVYQWVSYFNSALAVKTGPVTLTSSDFDVTVNGDATVSSAIVIRGRLNVSGQLTIQAAGDLTVEGDIVAAVISQNATGVLSAKANVYCSSASSMGGLIGGNLFCSAAFSLSANLTVRGNMTVRGISNSIALTGRSFALTVSGNLKCNSINFSGIDSTSSPTTGGQIIVEGSMVAGGDINIKGGDRLLGGTGSGANAGFLQVNGDLYLEGRLIGHGGLARDGASGNGATVAIYGEFTGRHYHATLDLPWIDLTGGNMIGNSTTAFQCGNGGSLNVGSNLCLIDYLGVQPSNGLEANGGELESGTATTMLSGKGGKIQIGGNLDFAVRTFSNFIGCDISLLGGLSAPSAASSGAGGEIYVQGNVTCKAILTYSKGGTTTGIAGAGGEVNVGGNIYAGGAIQTLCAWTGAADFTAGSYSTGGNLTAGGNIVCLGSVVDTRGAPCGTVTCVDLSVVSGNVNLTAKGTTGASATLLVKGQLSAVNLDVKGAAKSNGTGGDCTVTVYGNTRLTGTLTLASGNGGGASLPADGGNLTATFKSPCKASYVACTCGESSQSVVGADHGTNTIVFDDLESDSNVFMYLGRKQLAAIGNRNNFTFKSIVYNTNFYVQQSGTSTQWGSNVDGFTVNGPVTSRNTSSVFYVYGGPGNLRGGDIVSYTVLGEINLFKTGGIVGIYGGDAQGAFNGTGGNVGTGGIYGGLSAATLNIISGAGQGTGKQGNVASGVFYLHNITVNNMTTQRNTTGTPLGLGDGGSTFIVSGNITVSGTLTRTSYPTFNWGPSTTRPNAIMYFGALSGRTTFTQPTSGETPDQTSLVSTSLYSSGATIRKASLVAA